MNSNFDIPVEKLNEPGNLWIRPQNKQLRYSTDADKAASWLNPLPVYKASKEIKFGQPVSLTNYSQEHSISESGARARTIMPTNALENSSFIGIAIEYGEEKKEVHILNQGELVYEISKKDNPKYWLPPYHKNGDDFVFDWTDADVGSTVYITSSGSYTLNVDEVSGGNIMSVGKLVFAPKATETKEKQQKIIIHIQAGGDDRGVKDTAQFTVQMSSTIKPTSIESDYDQLIFVKINKDGLGEIIFNDDATTNDIESSPVGAIMVKSEDGLCDLTPIIGKKITLVRMGLISGNFGFNTNNVGKIGLLNDGRVAFKSAKDYSLKVGLFKSYSGDTQDFLVDCRFPMEGAESSDKIGTIKPVFGPSDDPLLDIGYALVDNEIHRTTFIRNDSVDKSGIDWEDLIKNCYTKDIFEFGRKINGQYVFSRVLEDFNGKSWSLDIYDTDETVAILNPETFFKFRNLYYTINSDDGIKQVACQIKFNQDSINTNEECIWPEEAYKIKLKATSDKEDYVLGGRGPKSTLFCNISRLVAIGNYMDGNGSNIETYDITVKVQSTGQILTPGFYQNKDGKWCGFEWFIYSNNGLTYLYMSTIPSGVDAKDCNGINTIITGEKLTSSDPEETLIVTVRRRPTLYNAVYLNQYPTNNPWMPYVDGNTGNLITENAIYFGSPSKLLNQNQTGDEDEATSGMEFNEAGRNGKIELTTEDSGKVVTLSTQVRGSTNTPTFKDKKQVIKSDGSISNTIEWEYDFANNVTSLNSYFAPILISRNSKKDEIDLVPLSYQLNNDIVTTSDFNEYLHDNSISALEILDTFYFRNIKYTKDAKKSTISTLLGDDTDNSKILFPEVDILANNYSINSESLSAYKDFLYIDNKYIDYMSFMSLIGLSTKDLFNKVLRLERIVNGVDFNKNVNSQIEYSDNSLDYIDNIGLLRTAGYLKNSLILIDSFNLDHLETNEALFPDNNYISIIDRYIIENFYHYTNSDELKTRYIDYRDKSFFDRLQSVFNYTHQKNSNVAQMYIAFNDFDMNEYSYRVGDFFKFLNNNKYSLSPQDVYEGKTVSADKIVFRKNVLGYDALCKDKNGYGYEGLVTEPEPTKDVYQISTDSYNPEETYYENVGSRIFVVKSLKEEDYSPNKYYIKRTIDNKYQGYPFRWPIYKDSAFNELDIEYNFFSKNTYGLDDSIAIYDDNRNKTISSFSSQSLEGITFDTISKLSFLYSCFDNNHTFESQMTWLLPFFVDDGTDFKYELKRLSQAKSIKAEDNKIYSAFVTRDNKIIELGSLIYNAYRFMFFESNAFNDTDASSINYENKFLDWRQRILGEVAHKNGVKTSKSIDFIFDLGDNKTYKFSILDNIETYKKFIFLVTQGKLARIKKILENDPYNAYKTYGDFFKKDYLISIDISTNEGIEEAKNSIANHLYSGISDDNLNLLSKFSVTPATTGPNDEYNQLGSYSTIVSEIKSLRLVEDATLSELQEFFTFIESFNNPSPDSRWDSFEIIDYARVAAYGSKNIVYYNESVYKTFNNIPSETNLKFNFTQILNKAIKDSNDLIDTQDTASLKVVWPSEINTYGQQQESLTFSKNNINQFIDRKVSDDTTTNGNIGIINIKTNPVSRISIIDENNIPDITVAELKLLLEGDETICNKCGIDNNEIKEYNLNIEPLKNATLDWTIPVVTLSDDQFKTLFEIRNLQYQQISAYNNSNVDEEILSTAVIDYSKEAIIYDLIKQGLNYDTAKLFADGILTEGVNISGGFIHNPQLQTTYGLLNTDLYGEVKEDGHIQYDSKLEGYILHISSKEDKNINDFKLKDLYNYNNIDQLILAAEKPNCDVLLQNLSTIKNYIELFFSHCDKFLKDLSVSGKQSPIDIKGTTYIDDFVDSETTNKNFNELKKSLDSITTIKKEIPTDKNIIGVDAYSPIVNSYFAELANDCTKIFRTIAHILQNNLTLSESDAKLVADIANAKVSLDLPTNQLRESIIKTAIEVINKSNFTLDMQKPSDMEDVKVSKAFNLEKYNNEYDRENNTGLQVEYYKYNELLPEYSYLYSKPSDGISFKKVVDAQKINGKMYHNNINTIVKHRPLNGEAMQKETFIGDRIELKEGMYLRGEQLPLPRVSLNISPYIQNNTQRIEFKPTYEDYASTYRNPTVHYGNSSQKCIKLIGSFPNIKIDGFEYHIFAIRKNIFTGDVFDKLPNGLKIIPDVEIKYAANYKQEYTSESGEPTSHSATTTGEFFIEGPRLYKNYVYSIALSNVGENNTVAISNKNSVYAGITVNTSCLVENYPNDNKYIEHLNIIKSTTAERALPYDLDLLRDIILNSDLFIYKPTTKEEYLIDAKDNVVLQVGNYDISMPSRTEVVNMFKGKIKHVSECDIEFVQ